MILMAMVKHGESFQNRKFAMSLQYLKIEVRDEVDLLQISCKVISLLIGMIKHSQSTQIKKFAKSLQYLKKKKKKFEMKFSFLHADRHQSFYKLALLFLMEVARYVQSTQNRKLVMFFQYIKKKVLQLLLFSIVMQTISIFYWGCCHVHCYLFQKGFRFSENLFQS